jgi:hypothetical protein
MNFKMMAITVISVIVAIQLNERFIEKMLSK